MENIDYNLEYGNMTRCRGCNRKTNPETDFKNKKNGKQTKTCLKCRNSVLKSLKKNPQVIKRKPTIKKMKELYEVILSKMDTNLINEIIDKDEDLKEYLNYFVFNDNLPITV